MRRTRVYIAGPISKGDSFINVANACKVWRRLRQAGYHPICPHWSAVQQFVDPVAWQDWIDYDLETIETCDAVLRLPGESQGADEETEYAEFCSVPVYTDIDDLFREESATRDDDPDPDDEYTTTEDAGPAAWSAYREAKDMVTQAEQHVARIRRLADEAADTLDMAKAAKKLALADLMHMDRPGNQRAA